ncbi:MAG: GAF domain-containing protein, partial [Deltaproteobacteria bacterium]|nr:GAF domain-containing protein [Deltaproteobacteria bacterium]
LPVMITFALTYQKSRQHLKTHIVDDLTVMAEAFEGQVYQFLEMNRRRAKDFASDRFVREEARRIVSGDGGRAEPLSDYIAKNKLPLDKRISRICVISLGGRVIASTGRRRIGRDVRNEPFFQRAEAGIDVTERAEGGSAPEIAVLTEVFDPETGRLMAWLANFTYLSGMSDVLSGRFNRELGAISWSKGKRKTMEVYLVNRDRLMITESMFVKDAVLRQRVDTLPVGECLEKDGEVSGFYADYRGVEVAGASMCLPLMGWTLLVEVDASDILAPLAELRKDAFIGAAVSAGLICVLLAVFYRIVVARLRLISRAAASIAGGDYDISVPVASGDEIGALSESFNAMARDVRDRTRLLREGEEKYRSLVSNIPDVTWTATPEGRIVFISPNVEKVFGYRQAEITSDGAIWIKNIHPDDAKRVSASYEALFREDRSFNEEYRLRRKDGRWIWVHDKATATYEKDGQKYADGVVSDITGRKLAEEREARLNRLYSVLSKISEAIVRIRDIPRLYKEAARIAVEDGRFMMAWVAALDEAGGTITPAACRGEGAGYLEGLVIQVKDGPGGMGPTATAILEGRLVVSNDIENDERMAPWRNKALRFGFRSSASLPLFRGGKAVGAISLYSAEPHFFNDEEIKLLGSLAADISFAVESIENERLGRQADEELSLLQGLSLAIREAKDFHSALDVVITGLCRATGWSLGEAWLPLKDGSALEYARSCGCSGGFSCDRFIEESRKIKFEPGVGVPGRVWESRRPLWITDITGHEKMFLRAALAREAGLKAQFGIPIIEGGAVLAVVVFFMAEAREEDKRLIDFVTAASAQLGPVLRSKLAEEARQEIQQRYEGLVNNLTIGVYRDSQGREGHIVEANPAAIAILEAPSKDELLKRRMSDFYADENKKKELAARMLEQGFIKNEELEFLTFKGRRLWGSLTAVMKEGPTGERYFDGIIEDITERKRLEDQLRHAQKMEAV